MARIRENGNGRPMSVKLPGIMLGIGLGGFADGIFLHQVFQWHHMFSSVISVDNVSGLKMNTLGDGIFHTATWLAVLISLYLLYSRVPHARRKVWGSGVLWSWMLTGWGTFNLVEGLIDHQILGIHHVHSGPYQFAWDMTFLASGVIFMVTGVMLSGNAVAIKVSDS